MGPHTLDQALFIFKQLWAFLEACWRNMSSLERIDRFRVEKEQIVSTQPAALPTGDLLPHLSYCCPSPHTPAGLIIHPPEIHHQRIFSVTKLLFCILLGELLHNEPLKSISPIKELHDSFFLPTRILSSFFPFGK